MVDCTNEAKLSKFNCYNMQIKIHTPLIWLVFLYMCEQLLSQITGSLYAKFV